jgi:hypothetical protein
MKKFLSTTMGLQATHKNLARSMLIRVNFYDVGDDKVLLEPISGNTLGRIRKIPTVTISREEYANREYDYYSDVPELKWAFSKLGIYQK